MYAWRKHGWFKGLLTNCVLAQCSKEIEKVLFHCCFIESIFRWRKSTLPIHWWQELRYSGLSVLMIHRFYSWNRPKCSTFKVDQKDAACNESTWIDDDESGPLADYNDEDLDDNDEDVLIKWMMTIFTLLRFSFFMSMKLVICKNLSLINTCQIWIYVHIEVIVFGNVFFQGLSRSRRTLLCDPFSSALERRFPRDSLLASETDRWLNTTWSSPWLSCTTETK